MRNQQQDWHMVLRLLRADLLHQEWEAERDSYLVTEAERANREYQAVSPARGLLYLAKRTGDHKGEVVDITPRQHRDLLGYDPRKAVVNGKGNVPWEYCLDQIATERGIAYDQELKQEIEFCVRLKRR